MGNKSLTAVDPSTSLLDRVQTQNQTLTEAQALTDGLVSVSIQEATNLKTATAMLGAGWVGRATRIGALTSLPSHMVFRGASYVPALAAESTAFAGIERGFHPSAQPFHKDWARSAVTLAALKGFGGLTHSQNLAVQHLFTDLGLVSGQHAGYLVGLAEKPQGSFAEQMLHAEATNWHMKGSLAFAHSLSPRLSAAEKSLEIFLQPQNTGLFTGTANSSFFPQLAMSASGGGESFSIKMASSEGGGGKLGGDGVPGKSLFELDGLGEHPSFRGPSLREWMSQGYDLIHSTGSKAELEAQIADLQAKNIKYQVIDVSGIVGLLLPEQREIRTFGEAELFMVQDGDGELGMGPGKSLFELDGLGESPSGAGQLFRDWLSQGYSVTDPLSRPEVKARISELEAKKIPYQLISVSGIVGLLIPSQKLIMTFGNGSYFVISRHGNEAPSASVANLQKVTGGEPFVIVSDGIASNDSLPLTPDARPKLEKTDDVHIPLAPYIHREGEGQPAENPLVRMENVDAIKRWEDRGAARSALNQVIENDPEPLVQDRAAKALVSLGRLSDLGVYERRRLKTIEELRGQLYQMTREFQLEDSDKFHAYLRSLEAEGMEYRYTTRLYPLNISVPFFNESVPRNPPPEIQVFVRPKNAGPSGRAGRSGQEDSEPPTSSGQLAIPSWRLVEDASAPQEGPAPVPLSQVLANLMQRLSAPAAQAEVQGLLQEWARANAGQRERLKALAQNPEAKGAKVVEFVLEAAETGRLAREPLKALMDEMHQKIPGTEDVEFIQILQIFDLLKDSPRLGFLPSLTTLPNDLETDRKFREWLQPWKTIARRAREGILGQYVREQPNPKPVAITLGALKVADGFREGPPKVSYTQVTDSTYQVEGQRLVDEGYRLTNSFSRPSFSLFVEYQAGLEKRNVDYKVLALEGPKGSESEVEYFVFERS